MIDTTAGILALLAGNAAMWFYLERRTGSKLFHFFPPLMFIYIFSAVYSNLGLVASAAPVYDWMGSDLLPFIIVLLLLKIDLAQTVRAAGRGVIVMLCGSLGVILGAPLAYALVHGWLAPDAWKGFGALAGSWIGGTANMAAAAEGLQTSGTQFGLAVLANNVVDLLWIPLMLQSKYLAAWFARFAKVPEEDEAQIAALEQAEAEEAPQMRHYIYLVAIGFTVVWLAGIVAAAMPEAPPVLSESTYRILIVTTIGILLALTPLRTIAGAQQIAMACVYLFVARMGATAVLDGVADQALPFVVGAFVWIFIHGAILLLAGRLLHVNIHMLAICSAANIGGAATAPVIAAYHDKRLVPVSILLAIVGYAVGNYGAFAAAWLCSLV